MSRRAIISMSLMQCIAWASLSFAGTGHTIRNGGGLGEIEFTGTWQNLSGIFAPCLDPRNLCGLSPEQLSTLKAALENRPPLAPGLDVHSLYRDDKPLSRSEMTELALSLALKCDGRLVGLDAYALATKALSFTHYKAYAEGLAVALNGRSNLLLLTPTENLNLAQRLREKIRVEPGFDMLIYAVTSGEIPGGVVVDGSAMLEATNRVHFHFEYVHGALELMVFP